MIAHSQYFRGSSEKLEPLARELDRALAIMEKAYAPCKVKVAEDFDQHTAFLRAVTKLDKTSTPGYPYNIRAPTIGDYLKFDGLWFDQFKLDSLWHDVQQLIGELDQAELYFNVFIKEEPHKMAKVESGRWRLIVGSPLHFQVLCHMLFDDFNDQQVEHCYFIPSQFGIKLNGGSWRQYRAQWTSKGYNTGLDKSAWDWTVPGWKIAAALEFRKRMCYGVRYVDWSVLASRVYDRMFKDPILILSDGTLLRQLFPGIMKSGFVNTISDNSAMQVLDHILVCSRLGIPYEPLPVAVGDDTLQCDWQVADVDAYRQLGAIIKSATFGLEFVGCEFTSRGPVPVYLEKHLYKACYIKDEEAMVQYLDAMMRYYVYSQHFSVWEAIANRLGLMGRLRSKQYYLSWYEYSLD